MGWFRDLRLGIKLNLLIVVAVALMALVIFILLNRTTVTLIDEVGQVRINQEVTIIEQNIIQAQENLQSAAFLLANTPTFIEAVAASNVQTVEPVLLTSLASFDLDEFDVINIEGSSLLANRPDSALLEQEKNELLLQTLVGIERVSILSAQDEDGNLHLEIISVRPLRNRIGQAIGGLLLSRTLNDEFLTTVNLARRGVQLALIYENQVIAKSNVPDESPTEESIPVQTAFVEQALTAAQNITSVINPDTVYSESGIPYSEGYLPLRGLTDTSPRAVLVVAVANDAIAAFQQELILNLGIILAVLAVGMVIAVLVQVYFTVIKRIGQLQKTALSVGQGDYTQRADIQGQDEIGQLGQIFNKMAEQVETRVVETEAARDRAERSDQVKSAFLASMSHELRTPLNAIINFTKFVARGDLGPVNEEQKETLGESIDSARHLLSLINDVLDMAKIESGSLNLFIQDNVSLKEILDSVVSVGNGLVKDKPLEIRTAFMDDLPLIRADKQRIRQILLNIMSNACKFTDEGYVEIRANVLNNEVVIAITDTGPGIAPEDQSIVFAAFKQTSTGLRQGGGTGLGMPISKNLTEIHGGRLWLESEVNKGSTFYVALPIKSDQLMPLVLA